MKAVVCTRYGPPEVLEFREVDAPAPRKGEVCIRIAATAVTSSDCIVRSGNVNRLLWLPMRVAVGFRAPRRPLGMVLAGDVASVGDGGTSFSPGDQVFGFVQPAESFDLSHQSRLVLDHPFTAGELEARRSLL